MSRITCSELIDRGELAMRQHDAETLARVLRLLASRIGDPLGDRLRSVANDEQLLSVTLWTELRDAVRERMLLAGS